jgi:tetratricopeptide (TPR) repeat protein
MLNLALLYANGQGVAQDYAKALQWAQKALAAIEEIDASGGGAAFVLNEVAWLSLFVQDFQGALAAAERAHQIAPYDLTSDGNRAHALMFVGRDAEARALYLSHRDEPLSESDKRTWRQAALDDFAEFRKAGLTRPLMAEIEAAFAAPDK